MRHSAPEVRPRRPRHHSDRGHHHRPDQQHHAVVPRELGLPHRRLPLEAEAGQGVGAHSPLWVPRWAGPQTSSCLIAPWMRWSAECGIGARRSTGFVTILAEAAPEDILPSAALSLKGCSDGRGWGLLLLPSSQRPHRAQKGCRACEATAAHQALELGPFPFTAQVSAWGDADRLGPSQAFTTSIKNEQTSASKLYRGREERKRRHPADTGRFCYHLFVKLKTSDKK
ncbi:uncharacterized protein LOC102900269 isoform X3 [Felis catus]|uniref:uncharacterized protein LOC102900269 isoform X3 n=1 Tax=Felis catus TaxID=9685 RepID=UPI001D1A20AB|nr:uncharacterized protein LOC102900269 isoform X3 [Felis catus]